MKKIFKLTGKILAAFLLKVFIYWLVISFPQIFFKSEQFENLYIELRLNYGWRLGVGVFGDGLLRST